MSLYPDPYIKPASASQSLALVGNALSLTPSGNTVDLGSVAPASTANISSGGVAVTTVTGLLNVTGNIFADNLRSPAFVYYVSTNGRLKSNGATGTITDPFSLIADALTMPEAPGAGSTIYLAPGVYTESFTITISATLSAVSIIGMSDLSPSSKRARITGTVSIVGTVPSHAQTINLVTLSNLTVSAPAVDTNAVSVSGVGIRVHLINGLYTSPFTGTGFGPSSSVIKVTNSGTTLTNRVQLIVDNCSITVGSSSAIGGACIWLQSSAQLFSMTNTDVTNRGGLYALYSSGGIVTTVSNSGFSTEGGSAVYLAPELLPVDTLASASVASFNNCYFTSKATAVDGIIVINPATQNAVTYPSTANISLSTILNRGVEASGVASNIPYIIINQKGIILIQRSQIISANSPLSISPYRTNTPATSGLYFFSNSYISASILVGYIPPAVGTWGLGIIKLTSEL
jgi:hypothetical protein